ncbi:thiol S-methyltransferase TMT1A-like isoform X2 [Palaemon carinicauda]|uniref:thiol S-methyltransferase TMT1A-like isoform X2 n=1 Tax=Palaemon carinicauda TaxID=392227 RepID=UPI0035B64476
MAEAVNEPQRGADSSWMAWVYDNPLLILITFVVLLILRDSMGDLRRRWFAAFANWFNKDVDVKMQELKKDVFAGLSSCESHDPELRKSGGLKILEIGVGTGEEMYMVPSNSVDVVVVTLVFCSVTNAQKVLKQILRVLVPGGKFYFFEHIAEFDTARHSLRKRIQSLLTNCGLWPFLFDNCHLTRDFLDELRASGFSTLKAERFHNHITHPIFQLIQPCLKGVAEK